MNKIYCDMDGVLVDFAKGAIKLVNDALENPTGIEHWEELKACRQKLNEKGRDYIVNDDLEKAEYRGLDEDKVIPEARALMKKLITAAGKEWWANLPWMPGGKELWNYLVENCDPHILSAPLGDCNECKLGKLEWVVKNLGITKEECDHKVILTDEKYKHAKDNVLIDDFAYNTVPWSENGGLAIEHVCADNTILALQGVVYDAV